MREILIVEDDPDINEMLSSSLTEKDFNVTACASGSHALALATSERYDFIILDVMLPEVDGIEICRRIRQSSITTPILMLTGKGDELDRVIGLEIGADDYMVKPFSMIELEQLAIDCVKGRRRVRAES